LLIFTFFIDLFSSFRRLTPPICFSFLLLLMITTAIHTDHAWPFSADIRLFLLRRRFRH